MNKLVIFILLILFLPIISGFGITPAQRVLDYEPDKEYEFSFSIINSESKKVQLNIIPQGELNGSIILSKNSVSFTPDTSEEVIYYKFKTPFNLQPGRHQGDILIVEASSDSASGTTNIGAVVGIITKVVVDVAYPGKYIESVLNINKEKNGDINFVIPVVSKGDLDITKVTGQIDIFNPLNEKVISILTNEVAVESLGRKELSARLDLSTISAGNYKAVAKVIYDGSSLILEKEFFVGGGGLAIKNINVDAENFRLGGIAKFEFLIENKLNLAVENIYVLMQVLNNNEILSEFKSATYNIDPLDSESLIAFWDTKDIKEGTYDAKVFIYSEQEPIQAQLGLAVSENKIVVVGTGYVIKSGDEQGSSLVTILIIVIGLLVLINLSWFLVFRRKIAKKTPTPPHHS